MNVYMDACHSEALLARPLCAPNPAVGAVIVDTAGKVLGLGHTQRPGQPHAEVMALKHAQAQGHDVKGATMYVSLEPCSHQGRTGPCTSALIEAGIARVIASAMDPNPLVAGKGFGLLRAAGIAIEIGLGAVASRELNIGFFSRMIRRTPWVRIKVAASLDGKTALENGTSQWLTSEQARKDGHAWRVRAGTLLTGIGTILADNPRLDARLESVQRQPELVIVDSRLETPPDAQIFKAERRVFIYAAIDHPTRRTALETCGATVVLMPEKKINGGLKVDLRSMLDDLARREINEIHVEAGHKLNGALIRAGLVDEFLVYLAPKIIGSGLPFASFGPLRELSESVQLDFISCDLIASDLRVVARVRHRDQF